MLLISTPRSTLGRQSCFGVRSAVLVCEDKLLSGPAKRTLDINEGGLRGAGLGVVGCNDEGRLGFSFLWLVGCAGGDGYVGGRVGGSGKVGCEGIGGTFRGGGLLGFSFLWLYGCVGGGG